MTTIPQHCKAPGVLDRIGDYLDFYAEYAGDNIAVVSDGRRISYRELLSLVDQCAKALLAAGITKGARVATLCTSRAEFWIIFLATTRIGALWVGLNPKYSIGEMRHVLEDCQPEILFSLSEFEGRVFDSDIRILQGEIESIRQIVFIGEATGSSRSFGKFLSSHVKCTSKEYEHSRRMVSQRDPAILVYTSGTSGKPKGAVLSHLGICFGAVMQNEHQLIENPVNVVNFPINHVACVADSCAPTYVKGGKIVFQERFDPGKMLTAIERERCTIVGGVPTMLQLIIAHPDFDAIDFTSVELVAWGGAAMPVDAIQSLRKIAPRLMTAYGMTETSANVVYGEEGSSIEVLTRTIGKPDKRSGCRIVDESLDECLAGVTGELQFKSDFLMLKYWNNEPATRATFTVDGWLKTGDLGFWWEDGNIELVGRMSDMFKSGGYNVYPREVELVLESISGVAMAAVIGVPDPMYQEVGHAFIMPDGDDSIPDADLRKYCKSHLANYKIPKTFTTIIDMPLLPVGKIDKTALKRLSGSHAGR